jgi:hypothetical protein
VPLSVQNLAATMEQESIVPTLLTTDGRVVVLGSQALLEGRVSPAGQRLLTVYGRVGTNYTLQSRFSLSSGTWANRIVVTLTNVSQTISTPSSTAPLIYFRVRE